MTNKIRNSEVLEVTNDVILRVKPEGSSMLKRFFAPLRMTKPAFTLAEVLITLAIIGVVAAITIPNLIQEYETRSWKTSSSNFERQLGEAIRVMNAQGLLSGFDNTKDFVENGLSKHIKILKICDNVNDCFPDKIQKQDEKVMDATKFTSSDSLGHGEFETNTVGVMFANGINGIIAYNPYFYTTNDNDVVKFNKSTDNNREYVSISTNAISMVYDVSGFQKPNMLGKDLFAINSSLSDDGESCTKIGDYYCIRDLGTDYSAINCQYDDINSEYCGTSSSKTATDYFAGATKACSDIGMSVPTHEQLERLYTLSKNYKGVPSSGVYLTSTDSGYSTPATWTFNFALTVHYKDGSNVVYKYGQARLLCVSD